MIPRKEIESLFEDKKSEMCEANSNTDLSDGWQDASIKAPEHKRVLGWLNDGSHSYYDFIGYVKTNNKEGWVRLSSGLFIDEYVLAWHTLPDPPYQRKK